MLLSKLVNKNKTFKYQLILKLQMQSIPELKELDLDDNEIRVYIACLKMGSSKVNDIAKAAELIRTTVYGVLESLIEKGLISTVVKENIKHFQAVNPKQLVELLEEKKRKIQDIVPKLEAMQKIAPIKHKVELFEGRRGIKTIMNELARIPNSTVRLLGSWHHFNKFSRPFAKQYIRKRKERKIRVQVICPFNTEELECGRLDKKQLRETRYIKVDELKSSCYIYGDKLMFVSWEEDNMCGIIIEDSHIVENQRIFFDNLWTKANPHKHLLNVRGKKQT